MRSISSCDTRPEAVQRGQKQSCRKSLSHARSSAREARPKELKRLSEAAKPTQSESLKPKEQEQQVPKQL